MATRRDPLETIALNVRDVRDAEKALVKEFGFAASKPLDANAYAPKSPPGSRVLYLTSATKTLTVILQPWREREALKLGDVVRGVVVAAAETPPPVRLCRRARPTSRSCLDRAPTT